MIKLEKLTIPMAELGKPNPLPDIKNNTYIHASISHTERVSADEARWIGKGMIPTLLPYQTQDGYDRDRKLGELDIIVLENEHLRAEFMPQYGARLRRLYDKDNDLELLYVNPVFQPCNLALRNAWFSGGVEFNVGIKGHNPLTCSPVFAERRVDADGNEYVSFYEYERIRGVVYSVNAYLPDGAKALTLRCVIENLSDEEKFMYWWSNIAVDEIDGLRIIAPTHESFVNYFGDDSYVLDKDNYPFRRDVDESYPENLNQSIDFFYCIPDERRKWIAAAYKDGRGLLHFSDRSLIGRKLFLWGRGQGGRHWAEYLSEPGSSYVELQAGLAKTQLEHFPMAAHSKLEWVEHYGTLNCTPESVHGDWNRAIVAVEECLDRDFGGEAALKAPKLTAPDQLVKRELLWSGSGWGALEIKLRGEMISDYFDDWTSSDPACADFESLLDKGIIPEHSALELPLGYAVGDRYIEKMRVSLCKDGGANHTALNLLGVALYNKGCYGDAAAMDEAVEMWKRSIEAKPNPWALRNLAAYYANELHDYEVGIEYSRRALELAPDNRALAIDFGQIMLNAGRFEDFLEASNSFSPELANVGRIRLLRAKALLALDRLDEAETVINEDFEMPDIKEGEVSISALWFELKAKRLGISVDEVKARFNLPYSLDYRLH